jgi:hypothetical protein
MRRSAAQGGSIAVMQCLQQQGVVSSAAQLTRMLQITGAHKHVHAAQWLRQQGAEWPAVLGEGKSSWTGDTLAWARAEGCTSPTR